MEFLRMGTDYARRFFNEEDGVTIVEMVIIVAVVLLVVFPVLVDLGSAEKNRLEELEKNLAK